VLRTPPFFTLLAIGFLLATGCGGMSRASADDKGIDVEPVLSTKSGQFRALLIGVDDYERLKDLKCCEADVTALRDRLVAMGFRPDTIKCLTTGANDPAYRPSYRNITERLDAMFTGLKEDAVLVIALSGHGGSFEWKDPSGKAQKASFYCPQDARLHDPLRTMVPVQEIYDRLEKCPARFTMLLVDACRDPHFVPQDDPLAGRSAVDEAKSMAGFTKSLSDPSRLPKGTLAMISCSSGEQSHEDPKLGHGIFMHYVLEGLSGKADTAYRGDGNNIISYRELEDYVYRKTSDHAWAAHERPQTPKFYAKWELPNFNLAEVQRPEAISPTLDPAKPRRETQLHLLAIGVSKYADESANLQYAAADAEAFATLFRERGAESYGEGLVHIETLLDKNATSVNIEKAIKKIAEQAGPQDVFMLTLSGHGIMVGQRYFFLPHEFTSKDEDGWEEDAKQHGLPGDVLQTWINKVPALKRVVVYDTSRSGATVGAAGLPPNPSTERDTRQAGGEVTGLSPNPFEFQRAFETLRRSTGCHVIAAATASHNAGEIEDLGHGVLTYALLAGLGAVDHGPLKNRTAESKDGLVQVRDWLRFGADNVPALTKTYYGREQFVDVFSEGRSFPILRAEEAKP